MFTYNRKTYLEELEYVVQFKNDNLLWIVFFGNFSFIKKPNRLKIAKVQRRYIFIVTTDGLKKIHHNKMDKNVPLSF